MATLDFCRRIYRRIAYSSSLHTMLSYTMSYRKERIIIVMGLGEGISHSPLIGICDYKLLDENYSMIKRFLDQYFFPISLHINYKRDQIIFMQTCIYQDKI